jgi:hypothetical protein
MPDPKEKELRCPTRSGYGSHHTHSNSRPGEEEEMCHRLSGNRRRLLAGLQRRAIAGLSCGQPSVPSSHHWLSIVKMGVWFGCRGNQWWLSGETRWSTLSKAGRMELVTLLPSTEVS